MKNCDDHVQSVDRRLCSPLATLSLPSVFSKHHGNLLNEPTQYRRESNDTSPKESACASLLFHGEVCLLLLLLSPTEFGIPCSSLHDSGKPYKGPPLNDFVFSVHWGLLLDTVVMHRIGPSHAQSPSFAMPGETVALPVNTDTPRPPTASCVSRSRACPTLIGNFYMRIHACATWRFNKEQYASLDTGEVCLPSYACVMHRASAVMAIYLPYAFVYKGRRPSPIAEHHTLHLLPELLGSLPRLHFNTLSASRMGPRPDLRASLAFHSEVCLPVLWHTAPQSQTLTSHCHSLRHENRGGEITTVCNTHIGLLARSYLSAVEPANPGKVARPASQYVFCGFNFNRGSLIAVFHLPPLLTVYKGRSSIPRTQFQQSTPTTLLLLSPDAQRRILMYRPVLSDASTHTDRHTDNMHLPLQGYATSQELVPSPSRINGTASLAISEVCSLTLCWTASLSKLTREVFQQIQHTHASHFTPTPPFRLNDSSRSGQCTRAVVTHEQQTSSGPVVSPLCLPQIGYFDDPKQVLMTSSIAQGAQVSGSAELPSIETPHTSPRACKMSGPTHIFARSTNTPSPPFWEYSPNQVFVPPFPTNSSLPRTPAQQLPHREPVVFNGS